MNTELTIVIPAKNEESAIGNLLRSLERQTYKLYQVPIILADADSTDRTVDTATLFASRLNLLGFQVIKGGMPAVGRNAGAKLAKSRYLLFLDADVVLEDEHTIENVLTEMRAKNLHCATTYIRCSRGTFMARVAYGAVNICQLCSRFCGIPFAAGMFMMFDRRVFEQLGGFHEGAMFGEDYLLSKQIKWNRFRVVSGGVETSDRRFQKMGYWKPIKLFLMTALLPQHSSHHLKDYGYWK